MFQHPALRKNTGSRSFGYLASRQYYAIRLPNGFDMSMSPGLVSKLSRAGVAMEDKFLPTNSVVVVYASSNPALFDYQVYWVNGVDVFFEVDGTDASINGMGELGMSYRFEEVLEARAENVNSFQTKAQAIERATAMWTGASPSTPSAAPAAPSAAPSAAPAASAATASSSSFPLGL